MLAFLLALIMMMSLILMIGSFIVWAFRQWIVANKYRHLVRLHQAMPRAGAVYNVAPAGPQWKIIYLVKGKRKEVTIEAKTEGEALKKFTTENTIGYGSIVDCVKS